MAQRCDPRIRAPAQAADRGHREHALASRSLERQHSPEGGVSEGLRLYHDSDRSRPRAGRLPGAQPRDDGADGGVTVRRDSKRGNADLHHDDGGPRSFAA